MLVNLLFWCTIFYESKWLNVGESVVLMHYFMFEGDQKKKNIRIWPHNKLGAMHVLRQVFVNFGLPWNFKRLRMKHIFEYFHLILPRKTIWGWGKECEAFRPTNFWLQATSSSKQEPSKCLQNGEWCLPYMYIVFAHVCCPKFSRPHKTNIEAGVFMFVVSKRRENVLDWL